MNTDRDPVVAAALQTLIPADAAVIPPLGRVRERSRALKRRRRTFAGITAVLVLAGSSFAVARLSASQPPRPSVLPASPAVNPAPGAAQDLLLAGGKTLVVVDGHGVVQARWTPVPDDSALLAVTASAAGQMYVLTSLIDVPCGYVPHVSRVFIAGITGGLIDTRAVGTAIAVSPAGTTLAAVSGYTCDHQPSLELLNTHTGVISTRAVPAGYATAVGWSPDSRTLAVAGPGGIAILRSGHLQTITMIPTVALGWLNLHQIVFAPTGGGLLVLDLATAQLHPGPAIHGQVTAIATTPSGQLAVLTAAGAIAEGSAEALTPLTTTGAKTTAAFSADASLTWLPTAALRRIRGTR